MADQLQHFVITVPTGITPAAPQVTEMQLGVWQVDWVEVEVPNGVNGQAGFYISSSRVEVLPFVVGNVPVWVTTNNVTKHWDLTNQPTSGDWQFVAYNAGGYPHTFQVTWGLTAFTPAAPANPIPTQIPASVLSS
jgi:hypothetical protein